MKAKEVDSWCMVGTSMRRRVRSISNIDSNARNSNNNSSNNNNNNIGTGMEMGSGRVWQSKHTTSERYWRQSTRGRYATWSRKLQW